MMDNYKYIFSCILHEKLKEKVEGKVFVKVTRNDELLVIIQSYGDIEYKTFISNFSEKILNGWGAEYAVYEIMREYKKFIMKKYFR